MPTESSSSAYAIIRRESLTALVAAVNEKMREEGYLPEGGICFSRESLGDFYLQAMVKT